jgi:hypothetical protein
MDDAGYDDLPFVVINIEMNMVWKHRCVSDA